MGGIIMRRIHLILAAFLLLSITFIFAIPPEIPMLIFPPDGAPDIPEGGTELVWFQPDYIPGPFMIEIYLDQYPYFPAPPVYLGEGMEYWMAPEFHFPTGPLQPGQIYYWKIRITYTPTMEFSESMVWSFITTQPTTSIISGFIIPGNSAFDVTGVNVSCLGAYEPSTIITEPDGWYSFIVANGGTYEVIPVMADYYFDPVSAVFQNVQTNLVQDFVMNSLLPHAACNPIPVDGDIYVPHDLGRISWQYIPQPGYSLPTEFEVYIPADAPEPIGIVPYTGRAMDMFLDITGDIPGESADAKVKGKNGHGDAIEILVWSWGMTNPGTFHTGGGGGRHKCEHPRYAGKVDVEDLIVKVKPSEDERQEFPPDSFFDVFMDSNIVPETLVYHGQGQPDPLNPAYRFFHIPDLLPDTIYHWFVRLTVPSLGDTIDSNNYAFRTDPVLTDNPPPLLVYPEPGAINIPPEGVDLVFDQTPWIIDSFFDVYCDTDPAFPNPPVYSGSLNPIRTLFEFHKAALLAEQPYYWYVRYTNFVDNWYANSLIHQFTTGQYVVPSSNISGTISSMHNVSACTVNCPQAVPPVSVTTGYYGTFSFTVTNGLNPVVTLTKQGYFFTPGFYQFNNISTNQTANFTMTALKPWLASQPVPSINAINISPLLANLQWEYYNNIYYSPPDAFDVWFGPVGECLPLEEVSFNGEGVYNLSLQVPVLPLAYGTTYEWKVVPRNEEGEAEGVVTWTFTTVPPPVPELLTPVYGALDIDPEGVYLVWDVGEGFQVDSFFDIYLDIDPDFPSPPIYTGPVSPSRYQFQYLTGALMENVVYYWKVRCHAFGDYWESAVFNFVTGVNPLFTYSTISGTITQGGSPVSGVTVTCPTACVPVQVVTQAAGPSPGTYSFWVRNGNAVSYVVTPTKNWWNTFTPVVYNSPVPVVANCVANFTMSSLVPNNAVNPWPLINANEVVITIPHLSWEYTLDSEYGVPDEFHIYIPHINPDYYVVPFTGGRTDYYLPIPDPPLDYNTYYEWWVVPVNEYGEAENVMTWNFTTELPLPPPPPLYVYPSDHETDVDDAGLVMYWESSAEPYEPSWSFVFDVYCDVDSLFPNPPIFSGPIPPPDPMNPGGKCTYVPDLGLGTHYYWKVVVTDQTTELSTEGPTWEFTTSQTHVEHPVPLLVLPLSGETGVGPRGVDFEWSFDPGQIDSFFDVFCDIDPAFPNPPIYSGPGDPVRTILTYHKAALLAEQPYYWFVRYSNFVDYWYSKSPVQLFTSGTSTPPPPPVLISPPDLAEVPPPSVNLDWTCDPDWWVESFFDVYCDIDPGFPQPPVYSGTGQELLNGGVFTFNQANLLDEQAYHWYVRITDMISGFTTNSPVWSFETGVTNPLILLYPLNGETNVTPEEVTLEFEHALWQPNSFFDIYLDMDPDFPEDPIYSGPMTIFNYTVGPLMAEQMFYWKVRVTQGMDQWTSVVNNFSTENYSVPSHNVSGTLYNQNNLPAGGRKITYYANNVYMGYVTSSPNPSYGAYTINLPDITDVVYKIVPVKPTAIQYWTPTWRTYTNLTSNPFNQDYTLSSFTPNGAIQPVPFNLATDVSINIGTLQWTYIQQPNYGEPLGFEVYFPAGSPVPYEVVPYVRDSLFTVTIPPLEYNTDYVWEVKPFNDYGWSEYMEQWSFTTEETPPFPPTPLYVYPSNHETDVDNAGLIMAWGPTPGRDEYPPDSFFDVFCDIDPAFPSPPIFSGPDPAPPDSFNPPNCIHVPYLIPGTMYYWKVVVTYPSTGISTEGPTWDFITSELPPLHPSPVLISPPDGSGGILPGEVPLVWDQQEYVPDSFFDIFFDINPINPDYPDPSTLIYSGPGVPVRTLFEWHCSATMTEQVYHWFVRYSNYVDYWFSKSAVGTFITGTGILSPPILTIEPPGLLTWTPVPGADYYNVYKSDDPYGPYLLLLSTPDLMWLDPDLTQGHAFYYVTAVSVARADERSFVPAGKK